jgi:uncharacterized protein (DUF362 family)
MMPKTSCQTGASGRIRSLIGDYLRSAAGHLRPRRIVLKPNWVLHETDPAFPIRALVTDSRVIEAAAEACLELFPGVESILVGDCPLQYADWPLMCRQSGLLELRERLAGLSGGKVVFRDLRKMVFAKDDANFLTVARAEHGDPLGYCEVCLGAHSHLEPISDQARKFAVNDYSPGVTRSNHRPADHRYLVSRSILAAELFINLPKWKAHQKSGITGALKNLVGINSDKAYLPHFRRGAPKWGGDEYRDEHWWLYWAQTRLRELFQKRSGLAYKALKPGWEWIKRLRGIETRMTDPRSPPTKFYVAGGAWFGNETIWRMIYDLNLIIQCADAAGRLCQTPQRNCLCIVDGLVSGEGNGPLQPLPRETDWLVFGEDPFAIDAALSWFMGFDPGRIPLIARRADYLGPEWGKFELNELTVALDGRMVRLKDSPLNLRFAPPPGWRGHLER